MTNMAELFDMKLLGEMLRGGYVRERLHPTLPLAILNYTERATYEEVWNPVTMQCRGLIVSGLNGDVIARPFPKFFNHGQRGAPAIDLSAPAVVTDKIDGSLGILYPTPDGHAIATRGSFTSPQALHATEVWRERYAGRMEPRADVTYLFEIVAPSNRVVIDYGDVDDLFFLEALHLADGTPDRSQAWSWEGPRADVFSYRTAAEALAAGPRPRAEGFVIYLPGENVRVKLKQADYVALHRVLTGTNARHVWEIRAVEHCWHMIRRPEHWGGALGIDPARAAEIRGLGDEWLAEVPDEFHEWVRTLTERFLTGVQGWVARALETVERLRTIEDRSARFTEVVAHPLAREMMRLAAAPAENPDLDLLVLHAWRLVKPEPTSPFARSEDIA